MRCCIFWLFAALLPKHQISAFLPPQQRYLNQVWNSPTSLAAATEQDGPVVNVRLAGKLVANQALIGSTIWMGGLGAEVLMRDSTFNGGGLLLGVLGTIPLVLLSRKVETSESPLFASLNLSTNMTVLRLFGGKTQPIVALLVSAILCGITGLVEEVTFRGEILPTLAQWSIDNSLAAGGNEAIFAGTALSTLLFAVLHVNPLGLFAGKEAALDAAVLLGFQLCTGSIFALLFLTTTNLAIPIVAHALYDFYTFYATHLEMTTQMKYAEEEALLPSSSTTNDVVEQKWIDEKGEEFVQGARQTFYLMDSNRDGVVSRKELRVGLFSYGINLSKLESEAILETADTDESGEIDFNEFLEFVKGGSTSKAIKNSLLGIR